MDFENIESLNNNEILELYDNTVELSYCTCSNNGSNISFGVSGNDCSSLSLQSYYCFGWCRRLGFSLNANVGGCGCYAYTYNIYVACKP